MTVKNVSELSFNEFLNQAVETENKYCTFYIFKDINNKYNYYSDLDLYVSGNKYCFDIRDIADEVFFNHSDEMTEYTILNFFFRDDIKAMTAYAFNHLINDKEDDMSMMKSIIAEHVYNCWKTLKIQLQIANNS